MTIIGMKSDNIIAANTVYSNLKKHQEVFEIEAKIISYVKCALLKNEELEDFNVDDIYVSVYNVTNGYELCFNDYVIEIEIYDKQIVDYTVRS